MGPASPPRGRPTQQEACDTGPTLCSHDHQVCPEIIGELSDLPGGGPASNVRNQSKAREPCPPSRLEKQRKVGAHEMLQALEGPNDRFILRRRLIGLSVRVGLLVGADVKQMNFTRGALGGRLKRLEQSEPAQFGVVDAHHDHTRLLG